MPVVDGEDTESDEEVEQGSPKESGDVVASPLARVGTVVSGEASETEDEDEEQTTLVEPMTVEEDQKSSRLTSADIRERLKEITRRRSTDGTPKRRVKRDPRYDTLLHRKLREDVMLLRKDLSNQICSLYRSLTKDVQQQRNHLRTVHSLVEDAGNNFRSAQEDLRDLEESLKLGSSGSYLPKFHKILPSQAAAAST